MSYLYLWLDIGAFIFPFILSFHPSLDYYKKALKTWTAVAVTAAIFIVWDIRYTRFGVWGFNPDYLSGVKISNLPYEEILFFICIPYSCLFTYYCFKMLYKGNLFHSVQKGITLFLAVFLIASGFINYDKLYTFYTFIPLAILLLLLKFVLKVDWLNRFYLSYLVLLIPFTIINGILTGTGLDAPVVWYNNNENMGIRMLTIPFEDIFYGMLLVLLNVSIFEFLDRNNKGAGQNDPVQS